MAEGLARHHRPDHRFVSAGIEKHGLNEHAVAVMAERGIDISSHRSQTLDELQLDDIDLVITVCDHAHDHCPVFPGDARVEHHGFPDPPRLAAELSDPEAQLNCYREVRDQIESFVQHQLQID